ncbi:DsbA family protein [uncultured Cytophaga sp.]|uniref:DsbA family protein n=1 Tax=uncultured Cytophaga sp. TaxID=160238 RepID=UPI00262BDADF|nr:DsbA family protein [uncultured Cytophaga sp.]
MKKSTLYISTIFCILLLTSSEVKKYESLTKPIKLIYVYDALCGWCYGFGPVINQIGNDYKDKVEIEILSGGMVLGDRIGPISNMSEYVLSAIPILEEASGVTFGQAYIELVKEGSYVSSSEKPSIALCVYKSFTSKNQIAYAHSIQKAFFIEARDINQDSVYANIATQFDLDKVEFLKRMQDTAYLNLAHAEFAKATKMGVTGYPTLLQKKENGYQVLCEGYVSYKALEKKINKAIKEENKKGSI